MNDFKIIDRRSIGAKERALEERAANVRKLYGEDYERWFREYYVKCFHETMLVDAKTAIMTREQFDSLGEYSCTLPTGTYIAKRWKRDVNEPRRYAIMQGRVSHRSLEEKELADKLNPDDFPPKWWMGEFAEGDHSEDIKILWREVVIV